MRHRQKPPFRNSLIRYWNKVEKRSPIIYSGLGESSSSYKKSPFSAETSIATQVYLSEWKVELFRHRNFINHRQEK